MKRILSVVVILGLAATSVMASPVTFNFTFSSPTSSAKAVGSITFESSLLPNPGATTFLLPNPAVLDLHVTVSGASAGNGAFGIGSFGKIYWSTGGATLDLTKELVGQPMSGSTWGTPSIVEGDFNLIAISAPAPTGYFFFTLCANAQAVSCDQPMALKTMLPFAPVAQVPTLSEWSLILLSTLLGMSTVWVLRPKPSAWFSPSSPRICFGLPPRFQPFPNGA